MSKKHFKSRVEVIENPTVPRGEERGGEMMEQEVGDSGTVLDLSLARKGEEEKGISSVMTRNSILNELTEGVKKQEAFIDFAKGESRLCLKKVEPMAFVDDQRKERRMKQEDMRKVLQRTRRKNVVYKKENKAWREKCKDLVQKNEDLSTKVNALEASMVSSKVAAGKSEEAGTVAKERCCGSEEQVEKLEEDLAKSEKMVTGYYKVMDETDKENTSLMKKMNHLFYIVCSKGNARLVNLVRKTFPDDFAAMQKMVEQEKTKSSVPVAEDGNRLASRVRVRAQEEGPEAGVTDDGPNRKRRRRDIVHVPGYDGDVTVGEGEFEGMVEAAEVEVVGQFSGESGHAKEGERDRPNGMVDGEELLAEDDVVTQGDIDAIVAANSERLNDGKVGCKLCGQVFKNPYHMRYHFASHLKVAIHPCGVCGKKMRTMEALRQHIQRTCSGVVSCDLCGKACKNKGMLSQHKRAMHKGGRT